MMAFVDETGTPGAAINFVQQVGPVLRVNADKETVCPRQKWAA
jgi:hypothetical protein